MGENYTISVKGAGEKKKRGEKEILAWKLKAEQQIAIPPPAAAAKEKKKSYLYC